MLVVEGATGSILALGVTLVVMLVLMPLARKCGWMDQPSARKRHALATPLVGGPAIFIGLFGTMWFQGDLVSVLFMASAIVLLTGVIDDRWPLGAGVRFALQAAACLFMVFAADIRLVDFGQLFFADTLGLGPLAIPITIFAALGVINAFNMIDGVDGLSSSIFILACIVMAGLAVAGGRYDALPLLLTAIGAALGFLMFNARWPWNPVARAFLGDSGSLLLGFLLAWVLIDLGNGSRAGVERAFAPMTAVWIFGLPLLDTTRLMANRWRSGRSAFEADEQHLHHAFFRAGFSVTQTWVGISLLAALFMVVGVVFERSGVPEYIGFYTYVATGLAYLWMMKRAWHRARFLGRAMQPPAPMFNH